MGNKSTRLYEEYQRDYLQNANNADNDEFLDTLLKSVDPYKVLGLEKDFTMEQLTKAFKEAAIKVHPDRGGDMNAFLIVKECFRKLSQELNLRESDKLHHELKKQFCTTQSSSTNQYGYEERPQMNGIDYAEGIDDDTNLTFQEKFNRMFEQNRLMNEEDSDARGYGHMMNKSNNPAVREDFNIERKLTTFSNDKFNKMFENDVQSEIYDDESSAKDLTIFRVPEAVCMSKQLAFSELGSSIDDFSKSADVCKKDLAYTDFKRAFTTQRLIDPRTVTARKEYKNVQEFENDWKASGSTSLSAEEMDYIAKMKEKEERKEYERLNRLKQKDKLEEQHFNNITAKLIRKN